jgi:hypothetical protein
MRHALSATFSIVVMLFTSSFAVAQTADPSGHWEGTMQVPSGDLRFEVDLVRRGNGEIAGTISTPAQHLTGLPLASVTVDGLSVTFYAREDQPFTGAIASDGQSMTGKYRIEGQSIPLTLSRVGAARIEPAARLAAIPERLEGTWNATVSVDGHEARLVLTMVNRADGSCAGSLTNLDEGRLTIPVSALEPTGSTLTVRFRAVGGSFTGTLNTDATELTGTFSQGSFGVPVTFRHVTR